MTSLRQIAANRMNALKSTGPRSAEGKQRSRQNAVRHGLTAETVITALEDAGDYRALEKALLADFSPQSATKRELVVRLASVLWRLRRATSIETGLFQTEAELLQNRNLESKPTPSPPPEWSDELDLARVVHGAAFEQPESKDVVPASQDSLHTAQARADCFLQVSRLGYGAFHLLSRYEYALWRQAAQLLWILGSPPRGMPRPIKETDATSQTAASNPAQRPTARLISLSRRRQP